MKKEKHRKLDVTDKFPYGLTIYDEKGIGKSGLKIIYTIETAKIEHDSAELNDLINNVKEKCKNRHVWVLYGSNERKGRWIPLQIASKTSGDVVDEIKSDFLCMIPFDETRDLKNWNSYFYKSVMKMRYYTSTRFQKYQKMKNMCKYLAIAILDDEGLLNAVEKVKSDTISEYQKRECDIALKIKPLFWNPAGKEFTYINSITSSSST